MKTTPEKTAWRLIALYGFNLTGMLVWPDQWYISSGQGFKFASLLQPLYYAAFLTALPVAALAKLRFQAPHTVMAGFFVCIAGFAVFPALLTAAISLPTFAIITLISELNFSALCLIAALYLAKPDRQAPLKLRFLFSIAIFLPAWSLLSGPILYAQAALKADGTPYCVAFPSTENARVYTPDIGFWAVRGIALAAKETQGGSESHQLSFHALLFIEGTPELWNWSKTTMRFAPLKHPELWSDLQVSCTNP
ncbi:MAG: hypothetical protein GQ535_07745 [Rhodobacteraceae bacterium]|nr:hypothetical protein [Paracoccaceae bacterium]